MGEMQAEVGRGRKKKKKKSLPRQICVIVAVTNAIITGVGGSQGTEEDKERQQRRKQRAVG